MPSPIPSSTPGAGPLPGAPGVPAPHAFPALLPVEELPGSVLVVAPHPDDEVLGVGGLLRLLALRGERVHVLVLTDGGGDLSGAEREELVQARQAESRAAAQRLGARDVRFLGLPDGGLAHEHRLVERLRDAIEADDPEWVLLPSPTETHADHRAAGLAGAVALERGERRVGFYGVNRQVPAGVLVDVTPVAEDKDEALACFSTQAADGALVDKARAFDRAWTRDVDLPRVERAEGILLLEPARAGAWARDAARLTAPVPRGGCAAGAASSGGDAAPEGAAVHGGPTVTAVISTWNKAADVCANLDGLRAQTRPFDAVVVVDNASRDDTADRILRDYPEVRLVVMPHDRYGACETFNIGFASARTDLIAILDDDVVLTPGWLEGAVARLEREPESTAVISTKIVEPGMPESYSRSEAVNSERYMSTFRGCASLVRTHALRQVGGYDERLFIYGNERDMTCRLLNEGWRVLQYPGVEAFHKTPFGVQMGKRSLYYHARNAFLGMLKYAPLGDLVRLPFLAVTQVLLRSESKESAGEVRDATGTIGIGRSLRETPGAWWVLVRAGWSVLLNVPYCLRRRRPVRHPDFDLPLK